MKNILITGGAGFIGSRLTEQLVERGYKVTILDNLCSQVHGQSESSLYRRINKISDFIKGDVRSSSDWKGAIKDQDIIVHLAAETGTAQSMYEIDRYNDINIMGTSHLYNLLLNTKHSIKKIIVASSRAIYGEGKYNCITHGVQYPLRRKESDMLQGNFNPICKYCKSQLIPLATDEESLIHPSSIYGISKHQQESMCLLMGESLNIPTVAFRYQNVYGPGQSLSNPYTGILSIFSTRILNGNNIEVYEDGEESRDFVYIDDVVNATILGIEKDAADGQVFNVGYGESISVKQVAESLKKLYDSDVNILINRKFRLGDIRHSIADISKIKEVLGFFPEYDFGKGILQFVSWVKDQDVLYDTYQNSVEELTKKGLMK